jgi:PAS domain S-box-containing protein
MKVATSKINKQGWDVLKDISPRGVKPILTREYQAIFKNNGKPMVIVEEDATISLVNAEFEQLSGYAKEEIEGRKNWMEFVARDDRRRLKEYHRLRKADPILTPRCFEFRFLDRYEKVRNIVLTIGSIAGTNKSMVSLLDVTDRRQEEMSQCDSKERERMAEKQVTELEKANKALQAGVARLKHEIKELQESEGHYRTLMDNVDFGINLIDTDHTIVMANAVQNKRLSKAVSDVIGKKCFREFEKRDAVCPYCPGVRAMATSQPAEVESETIRDDGTRFPVRVQAFPIFGQDGAASGFIEVVEDITERKRMELDLRQSEEQFRMLAENAPLGISIMAPDRQFEYFNPRFTEIFGYTKEDIPDKDTWFKKAYPDEGYRKKAFSLWQRDREGSVKIGEENPRVFTVRCKDGQDKIIDFRTVYLKDGRQYLIYEDITDRKRAEDKLRESEERYRSFVENIDLGINLIDADHNIVMVNAAQSRHFKKPVSETIGKKCYQEFEKRDTVCPHCPGVQTIATGKPAECEAEGIRDDQSHFHVRLQTFPIFGKDGTVTDFIEVVEDITKRKEMERTLRQAEERYRTLVETMKVGLTAVDQNGVLTYANDQHSKMLGYSMEEMIGRPTVDFQDEESQKRQEEAFAKRRAGIRDATPYEVTWVAKDGHKVHTILTPTPSFDTEGHFTGSFAIFTDITERKRVEELLQEERETFFTILQSSLYGVGLIDRDGKYLYVNPEFTAITGYTLEDVPTGRDWMHKAYPDKEYRQKVIEAWKKDSTSGELISRVFSVVCKDGGIKEIEFRQTPLADGRAIVMLVDITERKRAEEKLKKSEERYRTLVETMKVGLTAIDQNGVLTYVNEQHCRMLGYSMEEMIGHPTVDFQDEETRKRQEEAFVKRRAGVRDSTPYEVTWVAKDGHKIHTILTPTPSFAADGHFTGSFAIFTDITERKRLEERLQRYAAELERSNEEVKNFAYIVSHDLRVPLVNLKGYTSELHSAMEVIGSNFDAALPCLEDTKRSAVAMALHEDVPEALEFITNSVTRMDSFINAVLQLSRLGRRDLKPESVDMNALVQTIVETLTHQIREREATVTVSSLPHVVADRTSMEQIMGNILGNAVKYLDSSRPGQIEVTAKADNGETVFSIRDTGRGIAQEDMGKVFAPFRRAGKQDTPGEGMGLAYVQTLVRRHGGRIWCESELGKGTTFTFSIAAPSEHRVPDA